MKEDAVIVEREECAVKRVVERMGVMEVLVEILDMNASHLLEPVTSYVFINIGFRKLYYIYLFFALYLLMTFITFWIT
jgi:hypothetical protein